MMAGARVPDRVRWHCRRGLLELDLILARFLERRYPALSEAQRKAFEALLEAPDNDLLDLAMGRADAGDAAQQEIVAMLRVN